MLKHAVENTAKRLVPSQNAARGWWNKDDRGADEPYIIYLLVP